jgi:hypothetical protein
MLKGAELTRRAVTRPSIVNGKKVFTKRRTLFGQFVACLSNIYFRLSGLPMLFCPDQRSWQEWEIECFETLNVRDADVLDEDTISMSKLPGKCLWEHLLNDSLTEEMILAAAREFRRAHRLYSPRLGGPWSHGDGCMENVLYDPKKNRARLIDFEFVHDRRLSPDERHADDLLIFLLDLMSVPDRMDWLDLTCKFLCEYNDDQVIVSLRDRLFIPTGMKGIWWNVRTHFLPKEKVAKHLKSLGDAINSGALSK